MADDLDRVAALDAALDTLAREHPHGNGRMRWVYLLLTARRAAEHGTTAAASGTRVPDAACDLCSPRRGRDGTAWAAEEMPAMASP